MRDACDERFERSAGAKLPALKERVETLKATLADFKEGHYLSFTNEPAKGVILLAPSSRTDDLICLLSEVKRTNSVNVRMTEFDPGCVKTNALHVICAV